MVSKKYDVVIIGAGLGGLGAGALLAAREHKKVLVVEKEAFVGGRAVSFVGKGNKVHILGMDKGLDLEEFKAALGSMHTWIGRSEPDMETIFAKGLLDGYTFEAGGHGSFWGDKGRVACLMNFLGRPIKMEVNRGLAVVDTNDLTKFHQIEHGFPYEWMSDEGKEARKLLREMARMSFEEIERSKDSVGQFLRERNCGQEAYEYIKVLAASHMAMGEPDMMPASDYMKWMVIAKQIDMDLVSGACATMAEPGFTDVAIKLANLIRENGGEVLTESPVEEVIIENKQARGIVAKTNTGSERVESAVVICNIPIKHMFKVIPEKHFPADFASEVKEQHWGAGLLSGLVSLNRNLLADKGINPLSFIYVPSVIRNEGFIGDVDFVMWSSINIARRAPAGHYSWEFSMALTDKEMRSKQRVDRCIDVAMALLKKNFPDVEKYINFYFFTPSDEGYGIWRPVGAERPDVKCPWVEGLYFVGDQYGRKLWGAGLENAVLSAALCVDSITGKDYEKQVFPPYHRSSW